MILSESSIRKIMNLLIKQQLVELNTRHLSSMMGGSRGSGSGSDKDSLPYEGSVGKITGSIDLDTAAKKNLTAFVNALKEKGYEVIISSSYRTIKKQASLKSTQGQAVAKRGYSPHNFGLALDINIKWTDASKKVQQLKMASSNEEWEKIIGADGVVPYENYKLRWGGNFKNRDAVHFDVYNDPSIKIDKKSAKNNARAFARELRKKAGAGVDKKYSEIVK